MLQNLHNKAAGFFVKVLLGLLVASFAVWGIGDIFRSSPNSAVVQVGDEAVTAQEMKFALDEEIANYRRMLGDQYSSELIKNIGVPAQVLQKLVQQHLVEEEINDLGLVIPDSHMMTELRTNPSFHNEENKFDAQRFKTLLASNNLSEARYLSLLSKEQSADMLLQSLFAGIRAMDVAAELAYLYDNESRTVDLLIFKPEMIATIADPSDIELERFYNENSENFKAQEHRVISMVALDVNNLLKNITVDDEDILIEYQNRIDNYRIPEKRDVKQLLFEDAGTAQQAADALSNGDSIEKIAKELNAINENLSLGNIGAADIMSEAQQPVFTLKKGEHTQPIESSFGWHVFKVTNITPEFTRPLEDVKENLTTDIRTQRVGSEAYELSNTLQDDLAGGATLEESAQSVDTQIKVFGPISMDGTAPDGTTASLPEGYPRLLASAFELAEGETSNLMETDNGSFYALRVDSILPERVRALDEIKGLVIAKWKEQQK
ncbi:MAG: SurA N-terminal domain-containing protein, partial [Alphaproteobacteria bacterium]|nr:SurA N-terminal domain-containing protein [Alphaproteobacteria bacterium]